MTNANNPLDATLQDIKSSLLGSLGQVKTLLQDPVLLAAAKDMLGTLKSLGLTTENTVHKELSGLVSVLSGQVATLTGTVQALAASLPSLTTVGAPIAAASAATATVVDPVVEAPKAVVRRWNSEQIAAAYTAATGAAPAATSELGRALMSVGNWQESDLPAGFVGQPDGSLVYSK